MAVTLDLEDERELRAPSLPPQVPDRIRTPAARAKAARRTLGTSIAGALDERRLFILLPFAMIAGLITNLELPSEPPVQGLGAGIAVIAAAALLVRQSLLGMRIIAVLAAAWAGLCLLPLHGLVSGTPMLAYPVYGSYQARVDDVLSDDGGETRAVLSEITPLAGSKPVPMRRARILIKGGPALAPGDVIAGPMRFAPVPGPVYPGGFDTQFHAYFEGIGAYGNSTKPPSVVSTGDAASPARVIDATRRGIAARIDAVLAEPAAGVARAIITGDQSAVTDAARDTMATAGIAHVLSVSGLHLTIVAGGVFWTLRLLLSLWSGFSSRISVKRVAAVGGIAAAALYFGISGGNVAALRSTLMILLVFGAVLFGRRALTMRNVAIAGLVVIATDPASVFRPSFQLSFAAVIALVGAYENLRSHRDRDAGVFAHGWGYVKGIVVTSLIAGAATLVFSIYHFQQTSPLGVLGNLATLPLVGFVMMPAAALAVLAMPFGIEAPFLTAMGWSIDRMLEMAGFVAGWSEHLRASPLLTPWALVFGFAALAWFAVLKDRWRLLGPGLAVPLILLFTVDHAPDVLIADTTHSMVVRGAAGLELAGGKPKSFALDVWRDTYADPITAVAATSCDSVACIGTGAAGFTYAVIEQADGFPDECGRADLIVARIRAPSWCHANALIDADDLTSQGVQWLRWNAGSRSFEMRPAIVGLGRAWRIAR